MSLSRFFIHKQSCYREAAAGWLLVMGLCVMLGLSLPAYAAEPQSPGAGVPQITAIDVVGNSVRITASAPLRHTVVATADPFKVLIDVGEATAANFDKAPIKPENSIVSEISVARADVRKVSSQLIFSLARPAQVKVEEKGSTLEVTFEETVQAKPAFQADMAQIAKATGSAARMITDVLLDKTEQGVELIIKTDGRVISPSVYEVEGQLYVDVPVSVMNAKIPSKMIAPIRSVKYRVEQDRVLFIVEPSVAVESQVTVLDDELVVDIKQVSGATKTVRSPDQSQEFAPEIKKKRVSLDFQDADIVPIFRLLSDVSGHNIVVHPDVKGRITMKLNNAPWDKALEYILKTFSLEKLVDGNTIRVMTSKAYQDEQKAVAESRELSGRADDLVTKIFVINYGNVDTVKGKEGKPDSSGLKEIIEKGKMLSPRGSISIDTRTRSIIVKDIPSVQEEVQKLIATLDKQTPQVLIEARIVEVSTNFSRSLGVDWGFHARPGFGANNTTATGGIDTLNPGGRTWLASPGGGVAGTGNTFQAPLNDASANYYHPTAISLPATTTRIISPTSAMTLGYLNAAGTLGLDLRLSAIETAGKAKLLASPKILTFENEQALIKHGKKIPISTPTATAGVFTTVYIDANLKLTVTPQIAPDNSVSMKIEVNKDEPDYTNKDILGNPAIDTRTLQTQVMIKEGETLVIGGIIKTSEGNDDSGVPGFSKIPLLGLLFKRTTKETSSEEMIVFITPRIVRR